jgi:Tfp pilus assembly protein PilV
MKRVPPRSASVPAIRSYAGLTLVEVLMSMLVAGIGIASVIVLLPLSFVRAVQATNLTNGTILRFNAECLSDFNQNLLLRWRPNQAYNVGDTIVVTNALTNTLSGLNVTTAGTSGAVAPAWNTAPAATTNDGTGSLVWTAAGVNQYTSSINTAGLPYPPCFVIDPLGWNTLGAPLQTNIGNNGAGGVDTNSLPRFNGELSTAGTAVLGATLPDSWIEQARGPVTTFTANSVTIPGLSVDVPTTGPGAPASPTSPATAFPTPVAWRVVMLGYNNSALNPTSNVKASETRIVTGVNVATGVVSWGGAANADGLGPTFNPVAARVEMQDRRYTWMLTVRPNPPAQPGSSLPAWNVTVTVFFNRSLVASDEQVYQATGADGAQSPFTVNYPSGKKPFYKKGGFLFDCYFGRWYRISNIANDTGSSVQIYVDSARPQSDVTTSLNFGVLFMRGVVDEYPLSLK